MDKLSTLLLVLVAWLFSGTAYADDTPTETTTGTATFAAADGVLTVTASGDLTTFNGTVTEIQFTKAAYNKIFIEKWNYWYTVNVGDIYNPNTTYFVGANNIYTQIKDNATYFAGDGASYIENKEVNKSFVDIVKGQLATKGCTSLKFALAEGATVAPKVSADQIKDLLNYDTSEKNYLRCYDFSNTHGPTAAELKAIKLSDNSAAPLWVLPNSLSSADKLAVAKEYKGENCLFWYTPLMKNDMTEDGTGKYNLNVYYSESYRANSVGSPLPKATGLVDATTTNFVIYSNRIDISKVKDFDFAGIKNLVLDNTNVTGTIDITSFSGYTNVKRVILLKGNDVSKWTVDDLTTYGSVRIIQSVYTEQGSSTSVCQIKVLEPGALNDLSQAHYIDQAITNAFSSDIYGEITKEDFTFLNGSNMKRLNLANATYTGAADELLNFNNDYLLYLALPTKGEGSKTDPEFYDKFNGLFDKCKNLKGLSYYDSKKAQLTATLRDLRVNNNKNGEIRDIKDAKGNLIESGVAMGTLKTLTDMEAKQTNKNIDIKAVRLKGRMCAQDLGAGTQYDQDGHLVYKITRTAVQGGEENLTDTLYQKKLTAITQDTQDELTKKLDTKRVGALNGASIVTANLKNVSIDEKFQNDLCLGALGTFNVSNFKHVDWPTDESVQEIPTSCFANNKNITEICIPANVKKIGGSAFEAAANLIRVTTTGPSKVTEGNVEQEVPADTIDHGEATATFSANLKMIETGAFSLVKNFKDVYCLGKDAPQCQRWAFDTDLTFGNNGFHRTNDGLITRENFYTSEATEATEQAPAQPKQWIAVLHFPSDCSSDQIKRYTDPTREYSVADGKGTTDGNGHLLMWPKHTEMGLSYTQGHTGYTWKAWNLKRHEVQDATFFEIELPQAIYADALHPTQTLGNHLYEEALKKCKFSNGDYRFYVPSETKEDYQGWHEFVLTGSSNYSDPDDPRWNFDKISDNGWWTICLPFDMTKSQMKQVFGGAKDKDGNELYPVLCRLVSVKRDDTKRQITLNFGKDLVQYKDETNNESKEATDDESVVLHKGHPYMLKPNMPIDKNGKVTIPRDLPFTKLNYEPPTDGVDKIIAKDKATINDVSPVVRAVDENNKPVNWYYRFIGTFTLWYVPENCYFFAWYGKESQPRWFYKNYIDRQKRFWNPNTCVIMVNKKNYVPTFVGYGEGGNGNDATSHWDVFNDKYKSLFDWDGYTDKPVVNKAKLNNPTGNAQVAPSLYGFEGASGIVNQIKFNFKQADPSSAAPVYNLNGQMVSPDGDTSRLVKGIYIKNGRKFVVK